MTDEKKLFYKKREEISANMTDRTIRVRIAVLPCDKHSHIYIYCILCEITEALHLCFNLSNGSLAALMSVEIAQYYTMNLHYVSSAFTT